jgi:hypothetical protein
MVVQCGIVGVALAVQQCQAVVVGRKSGCGSGGHAVALLGWQQRNACTAALLGWEGGGRHVVGVGGFLTVAQHGIVWVALARRQWQAVVVGREIGVCSGGCAAALLGRQRCNACTAALLGCEGGSGRAAVLVRRRQGLSGEEGWWRRQVSGCIVGALAALF